jgi:hypothetical protein
MVAQARKVDEDRYQDPLAAVSRISWWATRAQNLNRLGSHSDSAGM